MITKEIAMNARHGEIFYHVSLLDSKNNPVKCRVNGKCVTWKTRPQEYKLPVKHGLYFCSYITQSNADDWRKGEITD